MKRIKNLYSQVISFENLLIASQKACRGKRKRADVHDFHFNLEKNLISIQEELRNKTYQCGGYRQFIVYELKKRIISAAPYKDRIVHHALCNIIEPIFDRRFISDSYACRKEKGQHKAIHRARSFIRKYDYVLKCDIQKYFFSIDHEILKRIIRRTIGDADVLWLIDKIIDSYYERNAPILYFPEDNLFDPVNRKNGMPIGNLTSQIFANVYLDGLDHYIKEKLRWKAYCRYVDDLVFFGNCKSELHTLKKEIESYLEELRLKTHDKKSLIFPSRLGVEFLGFRIFRDYMKVRKSSVKAFKKRLIQYKRQYQEGKIRPQKISKSVESYLAHLSHGNNYTIARDLLREVSFCKAA